MPKRSRSGVVSRPARVVAPISVNGGSGSVTTLAPAPWPMVIGQLAVLHRRIEDLLDRAREAVDLVDEEHGARLQRRQERGDVALALQRRAGGLDERHPELGGDDLGERGLAQAGRAGEQDVVQRLLARGRPRAATPQLLAQRLLADELVQPLRAQRDVEVVLGLLAGVVDEVDARGADAHRRAPRSAWAIRSSGGVPSGASVKQLLRLRAAKPRPTRPSRARGRGIVGAA